MLRLISLSLVILLMGMSGNTFACGGIADLHKSPNQATQDWETFKKERKKRLIAPVRTKKSAEKKAAYVEDAVAPAPGH